LKNNAADLFSDFLKVALPLLLIPATFIVVLPFGHDAANLFIGAVFAFVFLFKSDLRGRRLMIILSTFAFAFETANVASGFYHYAGHPSLPMWVAMGWAVLGWYIVSLLPVFKKIPEWAALSANAIALLAVAFAYNFWQVTLLFAAIAPLIYTRASSRLPTAFFAFGSMMGLVIEVSGTSLGLWKYSASGGFLGIPEFGQLALGYATVLIFSYWIAGYDRLEEKDGQH
jgi:hypothetical protein